jgi:hypothetical protein
VQVSRAFRWAAGVIIALGLVCSFLAVTVFPHWAHDRAIEALESHFGAHLQLEELKIHFFPVRIEAKNLVFRRSDDPGPPLVTIQKLSAWSTIPALLAHPPHVHNANLEGLRVQISRRNKGNAEQTKSNPKKVPEFVIDTVNADGAVVTVFPKDSRKNPLNFRLQSLHLSRTGTVTPMAFQAVLWNAEPPGAIRTTGHFGPWQKDDPDQTPVSGTYTFRDADLSVFRGISGKLASDGSYRGVLEHIEVDGTTDVPDFALKISGNSVDLKTRFHAIVDGTDGDTILQPVDAQFGHSEVKAQGKIDGENGVPGKTVSLDASAVGRLEDMMLLAVKGNMPPMTGAIQFHSKIVIPRGKVEIAQKLELDGEFMAHSALLTKTDLQEKINDLSHKTEGEPNAPKTATAASDFSGQFQLRQGEMHFHNLSFQVPGMRVELSGGYGLLDQKLDFHGKAHLQAELSDTTTGWKSLLLKVADPFFKAKNNHGSVIPIKITGTRDHPQFGLDLHLP